MSTILSALISLILSLDLSTDVHTLFFSPQQQSQGILASQGV